jgi:hypothetical protein
VNPEDIARLVLFDTWTRNCDRHPPDLSTRKPNYNNVFLSNRDLAAGELRLVAMDHTHCFDCGRDWSEKLARIDNVQDERLYGLFPQFRPYFERFRIAVESALQKLATLPKSELDAIVAGIPAEWEVDGDSRSALVELLIRRGAFLAEHFVELAYSTLF